MKVETTCSLSNPESDLSKSNLPSSQLVIYFMSPEYPHKEQYLGALKRAYPSAQIVGCTTGGEIADSEALSSAAVSAALLLEHSRLRITYTPVGDSSYDTGIKLAKELNAPDLRLIFVLSEGLKVNGSDLVRGVMENVNPGVILTGGLAGDGPHFKKTGIGIDTLPESEAIAAIGIYGDKFNVSYGSIGGWQKFGPQRVITRSQDNVLYELDGKPALDLYKKYLGDEAAKLPGSGLLFPLSIHPPTESAHDIVRTIVGINERERSLIFAGDIPQGYIAQLMQGNSSNLSGGAAEAAELALKNHGSHSPSQALGILVSCIGRNLLMGQNVSNEVEAVREVLGQTPLVGFYSYGEICHHHLTGKCGLHNQTMTITLLSEAA